MAELNTDVQKKELEIRHRGRIPQIGIYFTKFLRMFVNQSDWKVLPMTALIAGIVGFVMGKNYTVTMEGTLTGTFALVCVCIWNGCFNSIQVVCRERDVVKREHRAGLHISSYIISHMLYQAILCLIQTLVTLQVTRLVGMHYPSEGLFTSWFMLDFGISIFLVTYAADMMSLWISSICRSTTTAMTVMPFVLVFQLIFSGGIISIPRVARPVAYFTVSNPGFKAMASQADVNGRRYATISRMLGKMKNTEIETTVTLGQMLDLLTEEDQKYKEPDKESNEDIAATREQVLDFLNTDPDIQAHRNDSRTITTTLGELMDLAGEEEVKKTVDEGAAKANYKPEYEHSTTNIIVNWIHLLAFIIVFSLLSVISLEFIDKDKR